MRVEVNVCAGNTMVIRGTVVQLMPSSFLDNAHPDETTASSSHSLKVKAVPPSRTGANVRPIHEIMIP